MQKLIELIESGETEEFIKQVTTTEFPLTTRDDAFSRSLLDWVAIENQSQIVSFLCNKCPSLLDAPIGKRSSVHYAAQCGSLESLKILLGQPDGIKHLEHKDHNKKTALELALKYKHADCARMLINCGAVLPADGENLGKLINPFQFTLFCEPGGVYQLLNTDEIQILEVTKGASKLTLNPQSKYIRKSYSLRISSENVEEILLDLIEKYLNLCNRIKEAGEEHGAPKTELKKQVAKRRSLLNMIRLIASVSNIAQIDQGLLLNDHVAQGHLLEFVQKKQKEFLNDFKEKFSAELKATGEERISNNHLDKHFRRLDSIARLLEGNAICAAVYYHSPSGTLWIANNQIHSGSRDINIQIKQLKTMFDLISQEDLDITDIIDVLANAIYLNLSQEKRYNLRKLREINIQNTIKGYLTELFQSGYSTKEWRKNALNEIKGDSNQSLLAFAITKTSRLVRDFVKVRDFLLQKSTNALANGIFSAIKGEKFNILHIEDNDVHAEMRLLAKKIQQQDEIPDQNNYFGISKLCCSHCALALKHFDVKSRGIHGRSSKWKIPTFFNKESRLLTFFGESLSQSWKKFNKTGRTEARKYIESKKSSPIKGTKARNMEADSSDSDHVFGVNCSTSSLEEELSTWPLQDVWSLSSLKQFHYEECMRLHELGVPWQDIVFLAESRQKFSSLAKKGVDFINELACSDPFESVDRYEIFEDLCEIYEQNNDLFWAILDLPQHLKQHHSYDVIRNHLTIQLEHHWASDSSYDQDSSVYDTLQRSYDDEIGGVVYSSDSETDSEEYHRSYSF